MLACVGSDTPSSSQNTNASSNSSSSASSSSASSTGGFPSNNSSGIITPDGLKPSTANSSGSNVTPDQATLENLAKACTQDEDCGTGLFCLTGEFSGGAKTQDGKDIPGFFHNGYCALLASDFCERAHGCPSNTFCTYPPLVPKTLNEPQAIEQACDPNVGCGDPNLLQCLQNAQGQPQCFLVAIYLPFCIPSCDKSHDTCPEGTICEQWSETQYGCTPKCPGDAEEEEFWCQNFLQSVSLVCNSSTGKCDKTAVNIEGPCESDEDCPLGLCYKESDFQSQGMDVFPKGYCFYPCFNELSDYCGEGFRCSITTPGQPGNCSYVCNPQTETESCHEREEYFCVENLAADQKTPAHICYPDCNNYDPAKNQACPQNTVCCSEKHACMTMAECTQ